MQAAELAEWFLATLSPGLPNSSSPFLVGAGNRLKELPLAQPSQLHAFLRACAAHALLPPPPHCPPTRSPTCPPVRRCRCRCCCCCQVWKGGSAVVVGINLGNEADTRALLERSGLDKAPAGTRVELKEMSWLESVVASAGEQAPESGACRARRRGGNVSQGAVHVQAAATDQRSRSHVAEGQPPSGCPLLESRCPLLPNSRHSAGEWYSAIKSTDQLPDWEAFAEDAAFGSKVHAWLVVCLSGSRLGVGGNQATQRRLRGARR